MPLPTLQIAERAIGPAAPCFIIAEAGVNHNGSLELAREMVRVAAAAGADAVKFQTFKAEALASAQAPKADYQKASGGAEESQLDMLRRLELAESGFLALMTEARECGILFLSTPFEEHSADFLDQAGMPAFKIPSGELTNLPFLAHLARKGKPILLSTGMATLEEVGEAVEAIRHAGAAPLALLQCVSRYPADPAHVNLRAMRTLSEAFQVPVGYSDHTLGASTALAAVALGACVLEKHFTLDPSLPGPDHRASMDPAALKSLVREIRVVEAALGDGCKHPAPGEAEIARVARKSLIIRMDLPAGTRLTREMIAIKRPGTGLPPGAIAGVLGRPLRAAVSAETPLTEGLLA